MQPRLGDALVYGSSGLPVLVYGRSLKCSLARAHARSGRICDLCVVKINLALQYYVYTHCIHVVISGHFGLNFSDGSLPRYLHISYIYIYIYVYLACIN